MPSLYLGKIQLHWCDTCHVPVLGGRCSCGAETRSVPLTPPGDMRPAFEYDIELINRIYTDHFGAPLIPKGHLALLNKVPDKDRMEEIVVGGAVVGQIRYLPQKEVWEPIPRPAAAALLEPTERYVVIDDGAIPSVQNEGASVLAPGLAWIADSVQAGDEVFIMTKDHQCVGVGRARVGAAEARTLERGAVVRTRRNIPAPCIPGAATWEDAVRANQAILGNYEAMAMAFVRDVAAANPLPATVSFSGGKDSLVTLLIVQKALGKVPILFSDTGLEFPETYQNLRAVQERYDLEVVSCSGEAAFWETLTEQGPPAVDARWCCKVCKLTPIGGAIRERWGECLSFIGQRKYESFKRMKSGRVWRNPNLPVQLSAAPIQHWTALHVWLYLFSEDAPYNTLYRAGFDRVGCYMCPSSDLSVLRRIEQEYPHLWEQWNSRIAVWQKDKGLPEDWFRSGSWRKREGDPGEKGSSS